MTDSQCAVFHFDVETMSARDAEGRRPSPDSDAPLIFNSQADAEQYCRNKVAAIRRLGCRIYDRDGKILGTFVDPGCYDQFHGRPAALRNLRTGALCLVLGIALISLDLWMGLRLILGVVLGVRFVWVACVKMMDGAAGLKA